VVGDPLGYCTLPVRWGAVAVFAAALVLAACGRSDEGEPGGGPSLSPEDTVRAYVEALDERDGRRFCELVAPYISGRIDLYLRDPDNEELRSKNCGEFVTGYVGWVEDCGAPPREFRGAELLAIEGVEDHGDLKLVRARVRLHQKETCQAESRPVTSTLEERVWLARLDGAWRVVKLGELAHAASLSMPRLPDEGEVPGDDRPGEPPDLAAEERAFAALRDDFERRMRARDSSFRPVGDVSDCSGGMSVSDPSHDQTWSSPGRPEQPDLPAADLTGFDVAVQDGDVCLRWRLAAEAEQPLLLVYSHGGGSSRFVAGFAVELPGDGTARVTSGRDTNGHPVVIPAGVGADGSSVSLLLDRKSFDAAAASTAVHAELDLDSFTVMARVEADAPGTFSIVDGLGPGYGGPHLYPDGRECRTGC
jgi:hypothetical protein